MYPHPIKKLFGHQIGLYILFFYGIVGKVFLLRDAGVLTIEEVQQEREFKPFLGITIFTVLFGLLVILFLKALNA